MQNKKYKYVMNINTYNLLFNFSPDIEKILGSIRLNNLKNMKINSIINNNLKDKQICVEEE